MIFGAGMNIQVPPNLSYQDFPRLLSAGINDWGGVSPVTPDHVNPEAPWPHLDELERATRRRGLRAGGTARDLSRLCAAAGRMARPAPAPQGDGGDRYGGPRAARGLERGARGDAACATRCAAKSAAPTSSTVCLKRQRAASGWTRTRSSRCLRRAMARSRRFATRPTSCARGSAATSSATWSTATSTTPTCANTRARFCAFSKGRGHANLRGTPYDLSLDEVARRAAEAWERGATEVCMQGGIHPSYTGDDLSGSARTR